ncbi:MAG: MMPL family transporter [Syntrophaceae bacterium]
MNKLAELVTGFPRTILIVAVLLAAIAGLGAIKTPINYDIFSYMPKNVESIEGQLIMTEQFKTADTGFVMLKTKNTAEILKVKDDLAAIEGVASVNWISDIVDPSVPDVFIPQELITMFKNGDHALLHISFTDKAASEQTQASVAAIKAYLKNGQAFTGMPVFLYELRELVKTQEVKSVVTAVVLSTLVTAVATGSVAIPILFLIAMGFGIICNMGTNYFLGEISYITKATAAVIQLGVTIDFSIFLMHRFREETHHTDDKRAAMIKAMQRTAGAIIPCALVTMAGFLALTTMRIKLGGDMGIVMAKGVFFGLVSTMIILPALTLVFERFSAIRDVKGLIKPMTHASERLVKYPVVLTLIFVTLFIPTVYIRQHSNLSYSIQDILPQNLKALQAVLEIQDAMGSIEMVNILFPEKTPRWAQKQVLDDIAKQPGVIQTIALESLVDPTVPTSFIPEQVMTRFTKGGYTLAMVRINALVGSNEGNALVAKIRSILSEHHIAGSYVTGNAPISKDMTDLSATDLVKVDISGVISILLIVTIVFASFSIPVVLVAGILLAIFINVSIPYLFGHSIPYITFSSITAIQLGTCVNYAIFLMTRYREERRTHPARQAMILSWVGTAPAIITSGLCLFSATIGLVFISDVSMIRSLSLMIGRGAMLAVGVILILLPGVILTFDKIIIATSYGWRKAIKE